MILFEHNIVFHSLSVRGLFFKIQFLKSYIFCNKNPVGKNNNINNNIKDCHSNSDLSTYTVENAQRDDCD